MAKEYDTGLAYNWQAKMNRESVLEFHCQHKDIFIQRRGRTHVVLYKGQDMGEADDTTDAFALAEATIGLMEGS